MPISRRQFRPAALAALVVFTSLLSCGREVTGPRAAGRMAQVSLNPVFGEIRLGGTGEVKSIGSVVDFTKVRIVLLRTNGDTAIDRIVDFPLNSDSVRLALNVTLGESATRLGETFAATLKYINATGDTVFTGGPAAVTATHPGSPPAEDPPIPILYTGRGANAASLVMAPASFTGTINQTVTFSSTVSDAAQTVITGVPVAYTSTDSTRVQVNLRTGATTLLGARGGALVIAQTLTGQADTAPVTITPTASTIILVSGGNQQTRQNSAFPLPVRVQVNAADNVGVAGVQVAFTVTRGQGTPSPAIATTDAGGFAQTTWTAGDSAGVGVLRASVVGQPIEISTNGTQLSSAPTSLAFTAQPPNFTAGDTIPPFSVNVLDATGAVVAGFAGTVTLDLTGGTAGAAIVGNAVVAASNGVAQFAGLTVNRGGTAFRIRATVAGVPPAQTNVFNVTAAPPSSITVIGGANQTAPASTVLPDSVKVRVTNTFGSPVAGVTVTWTIASGGGTRSPATSVTDSAGRAATQWTIGATGAQQITAGVAGLQPLPISASIFVPQGQPTLFIGLDFLSTTVLGTRSVPVFVSPAPASSIVARLVTRDTTIAKWTIDSTIFTPGSTLRNPTLVGRGAGSTYAVVTSSAGDDSLLVTVDSASVSMSGYSSFNVVSAGDTLRKVVYLSEPAPPGGTIVTVVSSNPDAMLVAPGSGRGRPADECDYYCYGLRAADEPFRILATPAETAFVAIPAGQLAGQVVLLPLDADGLDATVDFSAPGYASGSASFDIAVPILFTYSYYAPFTTPITIGERSALSAYTSRSMTRDVRLSITSRNPAVVRVDSVATIPALDSYAGAIYYDGLSEDSTWVVVSSPGMAPDSVFVRVTTQRLNSDARSINISRGSRATANLFTGPASYLTSIFTSAPRATDLTITLTSSDPTVAVPDLSTVVLARGERYVPASIRAIGAGLARIFVTAPGAATDTITVNVSAATMTIYNSGARVGVGQVHTSLSVGATLPGDGSMAPVPVSITSSDPSILRVMTPEVVIRSNGYSETAVLVGRAAGTVTLQLAASGYDTLTSTFTVTPPALVLGTFAFTALIEPDSAATGIFASTTDGFSVARAPADTLQARLRSTNPAVLLVSDSIVRFRPDGSGSSFEGRYRAIAPGTARLIIAAPGYVPDTSALVTVRPMRLDIPLASYIIGRGTQYDLGVSRRAPTGRVTPFTVAATGPAGVTVRAPADSFPAGTTFRTMSVLARGAGTGTDTLILQSPGLQSDTVRMVVVGAVATPFAFNGLVGQDVEVAATIRPVGTSTSYPVADSTTLLLQVIDTAMIALVDDTMRIAASEYSPYRNALIRFRRPGQGRVRLVDPSGRFAPDSVTLYGFPQTLSGSQNQIFLSMGQDTQGPTYYIYRDFSTLDSVWVKFTSSAPNLVQAPDSVLMAPQESFAYFSLSAGDSVGSARVTASAPGYLTQPFDVFVSRGEVETFAPYSSLGVGADQGVQVYLINSVSRDLTSLKTPTQLRIRSTDPSIAAIGADSLFTIPAGSPGDGPEGVGPVRGMGLGVTDIIVEDPRVGAFQQLLPSRVTVEVAAPRLRMSSRLLSASVGLRNYAFSDYVTPVSYGDSLWIRLRSVGGKVTFNADSVLSSTITGTAAYFALTGVSVGLDTVVFTAPGYPPDTAIVTVVPGRLSLAAQQAPTTLGVNDSVPVTLYFTGADGGVLTLTDPSRTISLSATAGLQFLDAATGAPITSIVVPAGVNALNFRLKATAPGDGEITVTGPNMVAYRRAFTMITRP
ncbi:MAG: Ig-like domain-containing protein [Gemmatimonadetes bacterium]|nr:Ig-like domain-containing protein [Gemmatimonadota bacterium]